MKHTTVLLTSTGEAQLLRRSLPAAIAQEGADVVVVDNGCSDDTSDVAREHGAEVIAFPARTQYCAITNAAIAVTTGDAVLLLNADCFLEPGFLAAARPRLDDPSPSPCRREHTRRLGIRTKQVVLADKGPCERPGLPGQDLGQVTDQPTCRVVLDHHEIAVAELHPAVPLRHPCPR